MNPEVCILQLEFCAAFLRSLLPCKPPSIHFVVPIIITEENTSFVLCFSTVCIFLTVSLWWCLPCVSALCVSWKLKLGLETWTNWGSIWGWAGKFWSGILCSSAKRFTPPGCPPSATLVHLWSKSYDFVRAWKQRLPNSVMSSSFINWNITRETSPC